MDTTPPLQPEPTSGRHQLRRSTPFHFLNSDAFAVFFLIISLCFIFIVLISPFYSFSFHFLKPQFTRKSLDFLSLALVLFAIACGLLTKNNGENTVHEEIYRATATASTITTTTSNDSEQTHKSNPSTPNQWNGYSDQTDQISLHHSPVVVGAEYWRLSGGGYVTDYQPLSSVSPQHCRNLNDFEDGFEFKRDSRATFSVYDEEISSSFSALRRFSVPPLMTASRPSSPPVIITPPCAVDEAGMERINEGGESCELRLDLQALEDEISKNEKQSDSVGKELKENKKIKKKNKMKNWKKGIGNFKELLTPQYQHHRNSSPPPAPPPVEVHHNQTSSKIGETRRDFSAPPPSTPQELIVVRTQNSTGGKAPSTASEMQIEMKGGNLGRRNKNAEIKGAMNSGSPDVNSKADSFIETFRASLKLEMMNSIKERQGKTRTSILGRKGPEQ